MALGLPLETVYKLVIIGFCFPEIYGEDAEENIATVRESLYELYNEYVAMHPKNATDKICSKTLQKFVLLVVLHQGNKSSQVDPNMIHLLEKPIPFSL